MLNRRQPMRRVSPERAARLAEQGIRPWSTLNSTGGLSRTAVQNSKPKPRRYKPAVPPAVRDALIVRAGGWCEIQRPGCTGQGSDPSHRITQKAGGRHGDAKVAHDRLSNLMWACRSCHAFVTNNPAASKAPGVGWALEEWQRPAECPALYRGRLVLLADDGTVSTFSPNHNDFTPATEEVKA